MSDVWKIKDNLILIESSNDAYYPSANEIFNSINQDNYLLANEIRFSKIGLPIFCEITNKDEKIILNIYVKKGNSKYSVIFRDGKIIDYIIIDKTWHFLNSDCNELNKLFLESGIKTLGEISLKQYLNLVKSNLFSEDKLIQIGIDRKKIINENPDLYFPPKNLNANLYKYQEIGYLWLKQTLSQTGGCILGDEMGLGKTLQAIALCQEFVNSNKNSILIIAPVSLLANWQNELLKFAPTLSTFIHQGVNSTGFYKNLKKYDIVIVPYTTAVLDSGMLRMITWDLVILDEAQNIKNPSSERAKVLSTLKRANTLLITGTPFENHITDIWSLYNFILPGFLGELSSFKKIVSDDVAGATFIEPIISPLLLRRRVSDVELDLPEKVIIPQPINMSEYECNLYDEERNFLLNSGKKNFTLPLIQKLRMLCTHPQLVIDKNNLNDTIYEHSYKYQRVCEILEEIIEKEEKVIIFTSYKKMFEIFEKDIRIRYGIPLWSINGETDVSDRQKIVETFNNTKKA